MYCGAWNTYLLGFGEIGKKIAKRVILFSEFVPDLNIFFPLH